jgi:hypothetical protein
MSLVHYWNFPSNAIEVVTLAVYPLSDHQVAVETDANHRRNELAMSNAVDLELPSDDPRWVTYSVVDGYPGFIAGSAQNQFVVSLVWERDMGTVPDVNSVNAVANLLAAQVAKLAASE